MNWPRRLQSTKPIHLENKLCSKFEKSRGRRNREFSVGAPYCASAHIQGRTNEFMHTNGHFTSGSRNICFSDDI